MKANLLKLAALLAKDDNPKARNADIVAASTTLAALGRILRRSSSEEAFAMLSAIMERSGKKTK